MLAATLLQAEAAERELLLAVVAGQLAGFRVPGGDVREWLAEVTTLTLRDLITPCASATAERLLRFTGFLRRAQDRSFDVNAYYDAVGLVRTAQALAAFDAWGRALATRRLFAQGDYADAFEAYQTLCTGLATAPAAVATHMAPTRETLWQAFACLGADDSEAA